MNKLLVAAALAVTALGAQANGSVLVSNTGPLSSGNFNTYVYNGSSGMINTLTIDLGTTATPLTYGGLNATIVTGLNGGTATPFGSVGGTLFGFTFTGFGPNETFSFNWDPDTLGNPNYGAQISEFAGASFSAVVSFSSGSLNYLGQMGVVGPDVAAALGPVPEPATSALMIAGLAGAGLMMRRRAQGQAQA